MRTIFRAAGFLVVWMVSAPAARAETYYGPEVSRLARTTVDVLRHHQYAMDAQLARDEAPSYLYVTYRSTPAKFHLNDGQTISGGMTHGTLGVGLGSGKPTSRIAYFGGITGDWLYVSQFPNASRKIENFAPQAGQIGTGAIGDGVPIDRGAPTMVTGVCGAGS